MQTTITAETSAEGEWTSKLNLWKGGAHLRMLFRRVTSWLVYRRLFFMAFPSLSRGKKMKPLLSEVLEVIKATGITRQNLHWYLEKKGNLIRLFFNKYQCLLPVAPASLMTSRRFIEKLFRFFTSREMEDYKKFSPTSKRQSESLKQFLRLAPIVQCRDELHCH